VWNPNVNKCIDLKLVTQTPELLQRNLQLNPEFSASLSRTWHELGLVGSMLAVHVRCGDKEREAPGNFKLTAEDFSDRAAKCCEIHACSCVFVCSDNGPMKRAIIANLKARGFWVVSYDSIVSEVDGQGLHFSVPNKVTHTNDTWTEIFLMSYCCMLLCTLSNVSCTVGYVSAENYKIIDFWDASLGGGQPQVTVGSLLEQLDLDSQRSRSSEPPLATREPPRASENGEIQLASQRTESQPAAATPSLQPADKMWAALSQDNPFFHRRLSSSVPGMFLHGDCRQDMDSVPDLQERTFIPSLVSHSQQSP